LTNLVPDIEPLLQASNSEERAASVRALGRLGVKEAKPWIEPLLQDPVLDVRKAAQTALRNLGNKRLHPYTVPAVKLMDGTRSWTVGETNTADHDNDWRAGLRAMMGESGVPSHKKVPLAQPEALFCAMVEKLIATQHPLTRS